MVIRNIAGFVAVIAAVQAQAIRPPSGTDLPDDTPIVTRHQIKFENRTLSYTARAGFLSLYDDFRQIKARIFYVSYTLDQPGSIRPLTFAWNGGPGSPASTVHLALMGPRRAKTMDEYQ